jgi:hypothetical protein
MMVIHVSRLIPHLRTVRDERPRGGSSESSWRVSTARTDPRGRKERPVSDAKSTALGKEEIAVRRDEQPLLLSNDREMRIYAVAVLDRVRAL